jgi:hypothetical protein
MQYDVVYDLIEAGYKLWRLPAIFAGAALFILIDLYLIRVIPSRKITRISKGLRYFGLAICVVISLQSFIRSYCDYLELKNSLTNGSAIVIEGLVENFVPMPYAGHSYESFTVSGHKFEYSDYHKTGAFNNTKSHGGPIRQGIYVRITALGNRIVRLEVAKGK